MLVTYMAGDGRHKEEELSGTRGGGQVWMRTQLRREATHVLEAIGERYVRGEPGACGVRVPRPVNCLSHFPFIIHRLLHFSFGLTLHFTCCSSIHIEGRK